MGKAAPPHNKQCGKRLFLYTMELLETAGAKNFRESPGTLKALSYAGYFAAAGGRQERMSMSVPVVVDQASCLYDLFLILRHISDI